MDKADAGLVCVERVIANPERFKTRLAVGEDAFATRRAVRSLTSLWDTVSAAGTGASVAKSAAVAGAFFAPAASANPLVWIGVMAPAAAVTPIGWVLATAIAAGGAWYGVSRWLGAGPDQCVDVIPKFLNTPIDVLGMRLLDLHAGLALNLAAADGHVDPAERQAIHDHFEYDWGYDSAYLRAALPIIERDCGEVGLARTAEALTEFHRGSRDCAPDEMARELLVFLRDVAGADGVDAPEQGAALDLIERTLAGARRLSLKRAADDLAAWGATLGEAAGESWQTARTEAGKAQAALGVQLSRHRDWLSQRVRGWSGR